MSERDLSSSHSENLIIRSAKGFLGCLRRLHNNNDAITFMNDENSLRIRVRNDPFVEDEDEEDVIGFEVCLVDDDDDALHDVLKLESGGYVDDERILVLETYEFVREELEQDPTLLQPAIDFINGVFHYTICLCGKYLVKDDAAMCYYCHMTASDEDLKQEFCFVCHTSTVQKQMTCLKCCSQYVHAKCLNRWRSVSKNKDCPHCRCPPPYETITPFETPYVDLNTPIM